MANHPSAQKRHRQSLKRQTHNRWWKSRAKTAAKAVLDAAEKKDKTAGQGHLKTAMSLIQKAKNEGALHPNAAARKISRLSKRLTSI